MHEDATGSTESEPSHAIAIGSRPHHLTVPPVVPRAARVALWRAE